MKRKIAIFLSVLILISALIPVQVFAGSDNGLENALKAVKSKFEIPANLTEFNYNVNTEGKKQIWNLSWGSKNGMDGNINVRVDDKGTIYNYNSYRQSDYLNIKKFPKLSKLDAKAKAEAFFNKIDPKLLDQLKYVENNFMSMNDVAYNFNYTRTVNGIPFYNNSINIDINRQTGEVQNYYSNWTDDLVFPAADKVIKIDSAQNIYKQKQGLMLAYNSNYDYRNQSQKVFAAYVPKYTNSFIDAITGERIELDNYYGPYYGGGKMGKYANGMRTQNKSMADEAPKADAPLTPDEIKAVEKVSKLLTQAEAESAARKLDAIELTSEFKVGYANLSKGWPNADDFMWDINFNKDATSGAIDSRYISVRINAKTGEVQSFYTNYPYKEGQLPTFDEAASRTIVDEFIKKFNPSKYSECQYDSNFKTSYGTMGTEKLPRNYNFNYIRLVNGVKFAANTINIGFDTVSGKITNYNINWSDVKFPSISNIISVETAYDKFFSQVGLELQYKTKNPDEFRVKMAAGEQMIIPEVKLVYVEKPSKPAIIDANTGVELDYTGVPYKEIKPVKYSDISGNFAEKQIVSLAEYGISLEGTEFKPNNNIMQKDFLRLLSKTVNYYGPYMVTTADDKDLDDLYRFMISEGIVKADEKAPDSEITKEDAVKFIIRSLKFEKVANIKGIYKCDFKDVSKMNPDLIGAITIVKGLGIINGDTKGNFNPKEKLTRAQTAILIFNYLQI